MFKFKNPFHIPTPSELGRSERDALPSSKFGLGRRDKDAYTWEKYHEEVKAEFPVKYFMNYVVFDGIMDIGYTIQNKLYWLKCHTLPKYMKHKLDLRNPAPGIDYTYGNLDKSEIVEFSCWIALRRSVESGNLTDPRAEEYNEVTESLDNTEYRNRQIEAYDHLMAAYQWLMVGRLNDDKELDAISLVINKEYDEENGKKYFDKLKQNQEKLDHAIDMIIKYRQYLY